MNCKKEGAEDNNNNNADVDDIIKDINWMGMDMSKCAACGKGGDNLKACTSCKSVKYCNAKCRNAHRSKHKKECKKLAAERKLQNTIWDMNKMVISDEMLFAEPPPKEDCPICMLPIPYAIGMCEVHTMYKECCGKTLCQGCVKAAEIEVQKGNMKDCCAFCRKPSSFDGEERWERVHIRMNLNDARAFHWFGAQYYDGIRGFPKDKNKALKLWHRAAELGSVHAHNHLANAFDNGQCVEKDKDRAIHHWKVAAMGGHEYARHGLGLEEEENNNMKIAMKHFMIAARAGEDDSLEKVGEGYKAGHVPKDEYASTLRAYQDSVGDMRSEQRSVAHELRKLKRLDD